MQNDISQFVVNIVPLQNIQSNISGVDTITELTNAVTNIQQMVKFDTKTILTDAIQSFTADSAINILSPLNLCNVGIESNSININGTNGGILSNSGGSIEISTGQINFKVGTTVSLSLTETTATFNGTVFAQNFVTLSDKRAKSSIEEVKEGILGKLDRLHLYEYSYTGEERKKVGLLAQEVEEVFPKAILEGNGGKKYIDYDTIIGYLVNAIKELKKEIQSLQQV